MSAVKQLLKKATRAQSTPPTETSSTEAYSAISPGIPEHPRKRLRMRLVINLFFFLPIVGNLPFGILHKQMLYAQTPSTNTGPATGQWSINFSTLQDEPENELKELGFSFEKAMDNKEKINLSGTQNRLNISANEPAFGLMVNNTINLEGSDTVEIVWGINHYPESANWNNQINREAVMIYLFLGDSIDADQFYLPDSPHFIAVFLGEKEKLQTPYIGKHYKETGKYVCLASPEQGATVISTFNFSKAYIDWFGKKEVPPVKGIAIEIDTTDLPDGKSSAFIKQISFSRAGQQAK